MVYQNSAYPVNVPNLTVEITSCLAAYGVVLRVSFGTEGGSVAPMAGNGSPVPPISTIR